LGLNFDKHNWKLLGEQILIVFRTKISPWELGKEAKKKVASLYKQIKDPEGESLDIWKTGYLLLSAFQDVDLQYVYDFISSAPIPIKFELSKLFIMKLFLANGKF